MKKRWLKDAVKEFETERKALETELKTNEDRLKKNICKVLAKRFGNVPKSFEEKLESIHDMKKLQNIFDQSVDANKMDEIVL